MRIWIVYQDATPPNQNGVMRAYSLSRELVRRGHDVTIIASNFNHRSRRHLVLQTDEPMGQDVHDGIRFLWLQTPSYEGNTADRLWNMLVFAYRVVTAVPAAGLPRPDVVIGSSPPPFAAFAATRLARRFGVPFVLEVRDLWPLTLIDIGGFRLWHPLVIALRLIERLLYRRAARIVTVLPNAAGYMSARGATPDRIEVIPNGVRLTCFPPPQPPAGGEGLLVLYAGAHGIANGLDTVLDAAALLQSDSAATGIRFRLIGDGAEKKRLVERGRRQNLTNVTFADGVPSTKICRVLAEADVFVANVPSRPLYKYGISVNKLFEYMAMARPTVLASSAFNNPVAEADAGLIVPADDAVALAAAFKSLTAMPAAERWEMGLRGRRYVEEHHDVDHLAAKLERVLLATVSDGTESRRPTSHAASRSSPR